MTEEASNRVARIETKLDDIQESVCLLARGAAKLEAGLENSSRDVDRILIKLDALDEKLPELKVDVAKLHAKSSFLSATLGSIAGFIASKL